MTTVTRPTGTVWDTLVGQRRVIEALRSAAAGHGMSQAFLFTGPPGSGRSNAAIAFAAALQCEQTTPGLRHLPLLPHRPGRHPCRRQRDPHPTALARGRRGARPGTTFRACAGRPPVADPDRRGCRPAHRAGQQRPAEGDRGAHRPHRVDALRAHGRGPAAHDPLPMPAGHPVHAVDRRGGRLPGALRRRRRRARLLLRPGQPGPHRPGPRAGPRRRRPQPSPRGREHAGQADQPGLLPRRRHQPRRDDPGGGRLDHHRPRRARAGRPRRVVRRGGARAAPPRVRPRGRGAREGAEGAGQAAPPRRRRPHPDGPRLGLPRRDRPRHRRGAPGQRGDPPRRGDDRQRLDARAQPAPDRVDLRRPRADARVQRAARPWLSSR